MSEARALLSAHYQQLAFTKMNAFLTEAPVFAQDMEFCMELNEQARVVVEEDLSQVVAYPGQSRCNQATKGRQNQLKWVQTPIALTDLFKPRCLQLEGPAAEINKVLLVGEAGTGKTALTRKLAHDWATGTWGQALTALYVLPVRNLRQDRYHEASETLCTAIANECFGEMQGAANFAKIHRYIAASLHELGTLVILDGLDEHLGTSQAILDEAKLGQHKLLLTSRPQDMQDVRGLVDIEVTHTGLNVHQREHFIRRTLGTAKRSVVDGLLRFIQDTDLPAMCLIPVNLLMLCTLWKARGAELEQPEDGGSVDLSEWYQKLVNHIWKHFASKERMDQDQETERSRLLKELEKIASTDAGDNTISIDPGIIQEYVLGRPASSVVKDAGFLLFEKIAWRYHFPHLTFHEYFAGKSLRGQFC